jgi:ribosomal protein L32
MHLLQPPSLRELDLLRSPGAGEHPSRRMPRRRTAPWRRRMRALLREHPQLTFPTLDADEITSQLAHDGCR